MSTTRLITAACSLTPDEAAIHGNCAWCGKPLPRTAKGMIHKTRMWCGNSCQYTFLRHHHWTFARKEAVKRNPGCVTCGAKDGLIDGLWYSANLEVNHIHSLKDQGISGYGFGCHHHQDNLETLCRKCHVEVTKQQRAARKAKQT